MVGIRGSCARDPLTVKQGGWLQVRVKVVAWTVSRMDICRLQKF